MASWTGQLKWRIRLLGVLLSVSCCYAQTACVLQAGTTVFIPQMQGDLDGFIAAEFIKQHVPLTITQNKESAKYLMLGLAIEDNPFWLTSSAIFPGAGIPTWTMKDRLEGNVRLFDTESNNLAWSGEAGDRHLFFNSLRRSGDRKIAQRIIRHLVKGCAFGAAPGSVPVWPAGGGSQQGKHDKPYDGYPRCSFAPFC